MRNVNWERIAAASGFVFVPLFVIAFFVPGEPPDPGDTRAEWVSYALDKPKELKISSILFGLAFLVFLWFLGSLGSALRRGGEQRLAAVAFGGGVTLTAIAYVNTSLQATIAWRLAADEPQLVRGFADLIFATMTLVGFPVAVLAFATGAASWRSRIFPLWYSVASMAVAVGFVFAGAALAHDGFYAPDGGYPTIALIAFLVWVLVTTGLVMAKAKTAESSAPAPTM